MSPLRWAEFFLVRGLAAALATIPFPLALGCGRVLGYLAYAGSRALRRRVRENLKTAYGDALGPGESEDVLRGVFMMLGHHAAELSQMLRRGRTGFTLENPEVLREAYGQGRGVILVSAHLGCFAKLALVPGLVGVPASVIMKKQSNWALQQWLIGVMRSKFGVEVVLKKEAADLVGGELRQGRVVGFFADQRPRCGGITSRFFGKPVEVATGPAVLAKRYGAPLVVITLRSCADGTHVARCEGPLSAEGSMEEVSARWLRIVEERIRENPGQWMWMHRRWR